MLIKAILPGDLRKSLVLLLVSTATTAIPYNKAMRNSYIIPTMNSETLLWGVSRVTENGGILYDKKMQG